MTEYDYENVISCPNLEKIHSDVASSEMTDKSIQGCRWDETGSILRVWWGQALSSSDKTILDGIVAGAL